MRILGIDYGERRIGIAVSDPMGIVAMPLKVIEESSKERVLAAIGALCEETEAGRVVVGLPLNMNGTRGPMAVRVESFVADLAQTLAIPVTTWDERLSTGLVERVLVDADLSRRRRKQVRDKLAAQVILQNYLDAEQYAAEAP